MTNRAVTFGCRSPGRGPTSDLVVVVVVKIMVLVVLAFVDSVVLKVAAVGVVAISSLVLRGSSVPASGVFGLQHFVGIFVISIRRVSISDQFRIRRFGRIVQLSFRSVGDIFTGSIILVGRSVVAFVLTLHYRELINVWIFS